MMYQISRSTLQQTIPFLKKSQPSLALQLRNQTLENHQPTQVLSLNGHEVEMVIDTLYDFQNPSAPSKQAIEDQQVSGGLMVDWLSCYSQGK